MARATVTATTVTAVSSNGYNLTDSADFTTLVAGAGNGVQFTHDGNDTLILKNDTGGAAVFTFKTPTPSSLSAVGGSVTEPTVTVADGKTHVMPPLGTVFKQSDGKVYIECDVAGKVLLLNG